MNNTTTSSYRLGQHVLFAGICLLAKLKKKKKKKKATQRTENEVPIFLLL